MAIRVFITGWSLVGSTVTNPIIDHIDTQPDQGITLSMTYADADANGLPDKPTVMVTVESNMLPGPALEALKNLPGVTLIPGFRPDKKINELPPSAKADIDGLVAANKIPASVVSGSSDMGTLIAAVEKYISPGANGVATYLAKRPLEFG